MRLNRIVVLNYGGIRALEKDLGAFTLVSGGNGQGKTSLFDAIRSVSKSGKEPEAIHKDADEALIQIEMTIGAGEHPTHEAGQYRIERKIRKDGYSNTVYVLGGKKPKQIGSPGAFVEFVFPEKVLDPAEFARLRADKAADRLRELLTVPVTAEALRGAAGLYALSGLEPTYSDGITATRDIETKIREERKLLNASISTLEGNIQTFSATIDRSTSEDVAADLKSARTKVAQIEDGIANAVMGANTKCEEDVRSIDACATKQRGEVENWYADQLAELQRQRDEKFAAVREEQTRKRDAAAKSKEIAMESVNPLRDELSAAKQLVSTLEEKDRRAAEIAGQRKQLAAWEKDVNEKRRQAERMTMAIDGLASLQKKLMSDAPIENYEIRGGELYFDGVVWNRVNHAMRTIQSVAIATMFQTAGQPIVLDYYESLDRESKQQFEAAVFEGGIQVIAFERTEGPLTVETFDKPRAAIEAAFERV